MPSYSLTPEAIQDIEEIWLTSRVTTPKRRMPWKIPSTKLASGWWSFLTSDMRAETSQKGLCASGS